MEPAPVRESDYSAADPKTQRADGHDNEAKVSPAILIRYHAEYCADAGNKNRQPIKPSQQWNETYKCQQKGDKPEQNRDYICHEAVVAGF